MVTKLRREIYISEGDRYEGGGGGGGCIRGNQEGLLKKVTYE